MGELQSAITQLHGEIVADASALTALGVGDIFNYEPGPKGLQCPLAVTVSPGDPAMDALMVRARIRVYASTKELAPDEAQAQIIAVMERIDEVLSDDFGKAEWQYGWVDDLDCFVGFSDVPFGRDDIST